MCNVSVQFVDVAQKTTSSSNLNSSLNEEASIRVVEDQFKV